MLGYYLNRRIIVFNFGLSRQHFTGLNASDDTFNRFIIVCLILEDTCRKQGRVHIGWYACRSWYRHVTHRSAVRCGASLRFLRRRQLPRPRLNELPRLRHTRPATTRILRRVGTFRSSHIRQEFQW